MNHDEYREPTLILLEWVVTTVFVCCEHTVATGQPRAVTTVLVCCEHTVATAQPTRIKEAQAASPTPLHQTRGSVVKRLNKTGGCLNP